MLYGITASLSSVHLIQGHRSHSKAKANPSNVDNLAESVTAMAKRLKLLERAALEIQLKKDEALATRYVKSFAGKKWIAVA